MKMKNTTTGQVLNITEWFVTRNGWEYYVTDDFFADDIYKCLVIGAETELGDVDLEEVKAYALTGCKQHQLKEIMPATGWEWI